MSRTAKQIELGYGDLRYLKQLVKIAFCESQAHPDRLAEIAEALQRDATALHEAYVFEVGFTRQLVRGAQDEAKKWENRYLLARHRIRLQAQRITEHWIAEQLQDGFNPHGFFVYLLWGDDTERPIYVGESANVLGRLGTHVSGPHGQRIRSVSFIRCDSEGQMHVTERELIDLYQPELNRAGKRAETPEGADRFAGRYDAAGRGEQPGRAA